MIQISHLEKHITLNNFIFRALSTIKGVFAEKGYRVRKNLKYLEDEIKSKFYLKLFTVPKSKAILHVQNIILFKIVNLLVTFKLMVKLDPDV